MIRILYIKLKKKKTTLITVVSSELASTSPKMYRYLPRYGKTDNENMQYYALNLVNFGAHDIP